MADTDQTSCGYTCSLVLCARTLLGSTAVLDTLVCASFPGSLLPTVYGD